MVRFCRSTLQISASMLQLPAVRRTCSPLHRYGTRNHCRDTDRLLQFPTVQSGTVIDSCLPCRTAEVGPIIALQSMEMLTQLNSSF